MEYKNATIQHKANVYFDGKVTSRSVVTAEGEMKTLGLMQAGTYRFSTEAPEVMEVTAGSCRVKLADSQDWQTYADGESFNVPGNSHFEIEVDELLDYICHFEG